MNEFKRMVSIAIYGTSSIVFLIAVLSVIFGSWFTVQQTERAVVTRFGKVASVEDSGLHFKIPLIESVTKISAMTNKAAYNSLMTYSQDVQTATVDVSVNYHLDPAMMEYIFVHSGELGGFED